MWKAAKILGKLWIVSLVFIYSAHLSAQDKAVRATKAITDLMNSQLVLNEVQYKRVYDVNLDFIAKAKAVKQLDSGRMAQGKKLKALSEARDAKLKTILTPKQFAIFLKNKKDNRKKVKEYLEDKRR